MAERVGKLALLVAGSVFLGLMLAGCELGADKKEVNETAKTIGDAVILHQWEQVKTLTVDDAVWTDYGGKDHKGETYVANRFGRGASNGDYHQKIVSTTKISDAKYVVVVDCDAGKAAWKLSLRFEKIDDSWRLASVKELSEYPKASTAGESDSGSDRIGERTSAVSGVDGASAVDIATGSAQMKAKKNITDKLNNLGGNRQQGD